MIPKWIARFRAKMQNIEHVDIDPKGLKISQASTELHLPLPDDYKGHKNCKSKAHRWAKAKMEPISYFPVHSPNEQFYNEEEDPKIADVLKNAKLRARISIFDIINWKRVVGYMLWITLLAVFLVQVLITITKPQQEKEIITVIDYNSIGEINSQYQILADHTEVQKQILNDPDLANYKKEIINTKDGKILRLEQF